MATDRPDAVVVLCTVPDATTAERVAHGLVEAQLAACVNIVPEVRSVYRWKGQIEDDRECQLLIKTQTSQFPAIETWMNDHHPYDVPELVALEVAAIGDAYWKWMSQN